mgnify:FL=1
MSRRGRDPSGEPVTGLPPGVSFLEAAWETPAGEASFLEETANSGYFVLRVDEVIEPRVPELAEIEDQVEAAWREDRREALAEEQAEALAQAARDGGSLANAAQARGLETVTLDGVGRDGNAEGGQSVPQALARALFDLGIGDVDYAAASEGGYLVAEVTGRTPAAEASGEAFRENIASSLADGLESEIVAQLQQALRQRHEVTINDGVVERVY